MTLKKQCVACQNNNVLTPNKIFCSVPRNIKRRRKWVKALESQLGTIRFLLTNNSRGYCCEDHFCLKDDAENWVAYKLMQARIVLKKDVVPHIFEEVDVSTSQITLSERQMKKERLQTLHLQKRRSNTSQDPPPKNSQLRSQAEPQLRIQAEPQLRSRAESTSPTDFILLILKVHDSEEGEVELNSSNFNETSIEPSIKDELVERDPLDFCEKLFATPIKKELLEEDPLETSETFVYTGIKQEKMEIKEEDFECE